MSGLILVVLGLFMIFAGFLLISSTGASGKDTSKKDAGHEYVSSFGGGSEYSENMGHGVGRDPAENRTEVRGGGIIMLGPIPIIIGSDNKSTQTLIILVIVLMVLYFVFF
ncbi:TIGR00304 family membrane protein [Methanolobus profundi]|uniref:TIGR00304 family protein n=1 Tax=Methanolobus profundi TaxID=487685 RepID=A0A1I4UP69_9EURY|nr:DUF131 domain-containing protein [Methanolobus profundi]SFM90520.1 TIGR00304 family protein [Methanolobus profundi]